ncbi:MAG: hypothetical protein Q9169_000949 [Polycauliona sp. 2 TL-2023]
MAVGAHKKHVVIYTLKSMEQMRAEVQKQEGLDAKNFMPIQEERHIEVDGTTLKMELLHPSKGDENHIILLLIVSKGHRILLVRFEWDSRAGLSGLERKPSQALANSESLPLLLIPLTYGTSFAVVCEHQITVYKDILTGNAVGQSCVLEYHEQREQHGRPKRQPIWTQWARPVRPAERREPDIDNIYLCREDGVVRYIDIEENAHPMITRNYDAGILKANLGSAFATLDPGAESNDVIIAGGKMCGGGMWSLEPRLPARLVGTIRNWTPLRNMVTMQGLGSAKDHARTGSQIVTQSSIGTNANTIQQAKRLFACSGRGPRHGAVTEIRMGTEAVKLSRTIELGEPADTSILNMWALPYRSNHHSNQEIYLMIARPTETDLVVLPSSINEPAETADEREKLSQEELDCQERLKQKKLKQEELNRQELNLHERTIAAGSTSEGYLVQVTPSSINATAQEHGILPWAWHPKGASITTASFLTIPGKTTLLLIVLYRQGGFYLHYGHFGSQGGQINFEALGEQIRLPSEASAVVLQWVGTRIIAFVGTLAATVQVYTAIAGSSLALDFEYSFDDPSSICDSLTILTAKIQDVLRTESKDGQLVVCGLRNGTVGTLCFHARDDESGNGDQRGTFGNSLAISYTSQGSADRWPGGCSLILCETLTMGSTSVKVMVDTTRSSRAFAVCDQTLCTLEYLGGASPTNPAVVNKIWLTDPNSQAFQQGALTCFAQANPNIPQGWSKFAAGSLFYVTGRNLVLADVSSSPNPEMVPRHLPLSGTPTTVLYSNRLGRLIVMYTTVVHQAGIRLHKGIAFQRKSSQPAIAFIKPDAESIRPDQDEEDRLNVLDASCILPGERYLGLMEWIPTDGRKQYHMLVVHTATGHAGSQEPVGRLLFFRPVQNAVGDVTLEQKIVLDHQAEISAVASYGESSLVYGCGNDIYFRLLDLENRRFAPQRWLTLRSPAVQISVLGTNIHVSTELHGHHVLSVEGDRLVPRWADRSPRLSAYHIINPDQTIVIATDFECRIAGHWQPPQPHLNRTAPLIFEAFLPRPITSLCEIHRKKKQFQLNPRERQRHFWEEEYLPTEVILGSSDDGTIYQLSLIDEASWRLLAYIQNMAARDPRICPYRNPQMRGLDLEPSTTRKENMHIDGDLLIRLLERGGTKLLREMLDERSSSTRILLDEMLIDDHSEDRWHRLRALWTDVSKGDASTIPNSRTSVRDAEIGEMVLGWIRSLLVPAI